MRQQNFSLETIGMLQLLKLPWILKFLWSPAIDRSCQTLVDYKRWIFSAELLYAIIILIISFLNFETSPLLIICLVMMSFVASATQDIATDALAVLSFDKQNRSLVNSMQSMGSFGGAVIGGGVLLLVFNHWGWNTMLPFLASFVMVALVPLLFFSDNDHSISDSPKDLPKASINDLLGFFKQEGIGKQVIFLLLYYAGAIGILAMLKPMLVDYKYSIQEIGIMSGLVGTTVGCFASFAGGIFVRRLSMRTARILFAIPIMLTASYFYILTTNTLPINNITLYIGIILLWMSYGMATIVVYTSAMNCVRKGFEGTDFTIQTVITHISGIFMAVISGRIAAVWQYQGLFIVEMLIGACSLIFILVAFREKKTLSPS